MIKYLALGVLVIVTVGFAGREMMVLPSGDVPDLLQVLADNQRIDKKVACYQAFKEVLESTVVYLGKGDLRLQEAALRVQEAAQEYAPVYLRRVAISDPGKSSLESVVRNLIGHVRIRSGAYPDSRPQQRSLEAELIEMLAGHE